MVVVVVVVVVLFDRVLSFIYVYRPLSLKSNDVDLHVAYFIVRDEQTSHVLMLLAHCSAQTIGLIVFSADRAGMTRACPPFIIHVGDG